jgi:hypothetical protein
VIDGITGAAEEKSDTTTQKNNISPDKARMRCECHIVLQWSQSWTPGVRNEVTFEGQSEKADSLTKNY